MDRSYRVFGLATLVMLATVIAVMAMLMVFEQSLQTDVQRTRVRSPILVTRSVTLNAGTRGAITVPMAWSRNDLHTLLQGLEQLGSASGFSSSIGFIGRVSGRYEQVTLLRVGEDMLAYFAPRGTCRTDTLYLYDARNRVIGDGEKGRFENHFVRLLPLANSAVLKVLAPGETGVMALQCDPATNDRFLKVVFLPRPGMEKSAMVALRSRAEAGAWNHSDFAPATVMVESLSEAVAERMEADFGWLPPFAAAFGFLLLVILAGFALFDAARIRPEFQIRRAVGSSMSCLLYTSAQRVLRMLGMAAVVAASFLGSGWLFTDTRIFQDGWRGLFWAGVVLLLSGLGGVASHAAYVLLRLDDQLTLTTNVAGSRWKTIMVGVCMAVMTFSLALFAMFSYGLNTYFRQLQNMPLGYAPTGLYAYAAIPLSARGRAGEDVSSLLAEPLRSLSPASVGGQISLICDGPWSLDGLLANPALKHAGISIKGSAGLLDLLQLRHTGRDILADDLHTGTASWIQGDDPQFIRAATQRGHVLGAVAGVRVGALAPQERSIIFEAIDNTPCPAPVVLYRSSRIAANQQSNSLEGVRARVQALTTDYSIQAPKQVSAIIAQARQPLLQLTRFANWGFLAAFLCMVLVAGLSSAAYVNSRARIIAIRSAVGESPWRAALDATYRGGLHVLPMLALAAMASGWANSLVRLKFPGYPGLDGLRLLGLSLLIGAVIQVVMFICLWKALSRTDFSTALRVD